MTAAERTLSEIVQLLNRFLVLPEYGPDVTALYVVSTYLVDIAQFAPLFVLRSPEKRCGKTTTMDIIGELVREPLAASNTSPAALYRAMEEFRPTVLLDEVDAYLQVKSEQSEAIRGVLNAGHRRGRYSQIIRSTEKGELQRFDVFGHKVLSGIGHVHTTLQDRAITLSLRRKRPDETVERLRIARMEQVFSEYREAIESVADEVRETVANADPMIPEELSDRAADNWEMLFAIADAAGGIWPELSRAAAKKLSDGDEGASARTLLLSDIRDYLDEKEYFIARTESLLAYLNAIEIRPWSTWSRGENMTARDLAKQLQPFGVEPRQGKVHGEKVRGYRREDLEDVFLRYLTPKISGTPVPDEDNSLQDNDLSRYRQNEGYRYHAVPSNGNQEGASEGTTGYRYHENIRYPDKSIQYNELDESGTGVPANTEVSEPELEIF